MDLPRTCSIAALLLSVSCSTPVPLDKAIGNLEVDLKNAGVVSASDAMSSDNIAVSSFDQKVEGLQCWYHASNPIIAVFAKDFSLQLSGQFSATGHFNVSGIPTAVGGLGLDVGRTTSQQLTVPVTFTSAQNLPNIWLQQSLALLSGIPSAMLTLRAPPQQHFADEPDESAELPPLSKPAIVGGKYSLNYLLERRDRFQRHMDSLVIQFHEASCPPQTSPGDVSHIPPPVIAVPPE